MCSGRVTSKYLDVTLLQHSDAIEEEFLVPQRDIYSNVLIRTIFFLLFNKLKIFFPQQSLKGS